MVAIKPRNRHACWGKAHINTHVFTVCCTYVHVLEKQVFLFFRLRTLIPKWFSPDTMLMRVVSHSPLTIQGNIPSVLGPTVHAGLVETDWCVCVCTIIIRLSILFLTASAPGHLHRGACHWLWSDSSQRETEWAAVESEATPWPGRADHQGTGIPKGEPV